MKKISIGLIMLVCLIMGGTIANSEESKFGVRGVALTPAEAKLIELDPFFGIGIYSRKLESDAVINFGLDVLSGSGILRTEVLYADGTTESTEIDFDDTLILGSYNHGFLLGSSKGKSFKDGLTYLVLGGGLVIESINIETESEDIAESGFGFLINGGIGYSNERVDLLALYSIIPGSGNVTGAFYLSLGVKF